MTFVTTNDLKSLREKQENCLWVCVFVAIIFFWGAMNYLDKRLDNLESFQKQTNKDLNVIDKKRVEKE